MDKKRLIGLDVFRVLAAIMIFMFHARTGMNYYFGALHSFFRMGAVFMTGFFILSGFCLYTSNQKKDLMKLDDMTSFYIKRFISIMPLYYVAALLYTVLVGRETVWENIVLAPMQILGLQATMRPMFSLSHHSGTWFISALVILYLLYPFMQEMVKQISLKAQIILLCISSFSLMWVAIVIWKFKMVDIYTNPFYRGLEFFIGVLLAASKEELGKMKFFRFFMQWKIFWIELIILIVSVHVAVEEDFAVGNYMTYDMFCLPIFMLMIFTLSGVQSVTLEKSKILRYMSDASYAFFLAQLFIWVPLGKLVKYLKLEHYHVEKVLVGLVLCMVVAVVLHEGVEKPLKKLCMSMYNKFLITKGKNK